MNHFQWTTVINWLYKMFQFEALFLASPKKCISFCKITMIKPLEVPRAAFLERVFSLVFSPMNWLLVSRCSFYVELFIFHPKALFISIYDIKWFRSVFDVLKAPTNVSSKRVGLTMTFVVHRHYMPPSPEPNVDTDHHCHPHCHVWLSSSS